MKWLHVFIGVRNLMGWDVMKRKNRRGSSEKELPGGGGRLIVKVGLSMGCCIGAFHYVDRPR